MAVFQQPRLSVIPGLTLKSKQPFLNLTDRVGIHIDAMSMPYFTRDNMLVVLSASIGLCILVSVGHCKPAPGGPNHQILPQSSVEASCSGVEN